MARAVCCAWGLLCIWLICWLVPAQAADSAKCLDCHGKLNPQLVMDWELSEHQKNGVECIECHGDGHVSEEDVDKARLAQPSTCAQCHEQQVKRFSAGKHAKAWLAMNAMPTIHWQAQALVEGMKGCGGCHKLGLKTDQEIEKLKKEGSGYGFASCDACHTRHLFSVVEARQPQACRTCHMGMDHPQWEMYSSSKHGVRNNLKQMEKLPPEAAAPTCQTCHMPEGDHAVGTAWGFLAVRLPLADDKQWAADQAAILKGLGVLSPDGKPTPRLDLVKAGQVARLNEKEWQEKRNQMLGVCQKCHTAKFARGELAKGDDLIRAADRLMAQAIELVAGLYRDGFLKKPKDYAHPYPDLLAFHDAATLIEQKLFVMFLKHRMRTFQGGFHQNPDYALWYGWSEMVRDLTEMRHLASDLRRRAGKGRVH